MKDVVSIVNRTLNMARKKFQLTSDDALSKHLGTSDLAIYRWRNGKLPKAVKILVPLIVEMSGDMQDETGQSRVTALARDVREREIKQ